MDLSPVRHCSGHFDVLVLYTIISSHPRNAEGYNVWFLALVRRTFLIILGICEDGHCTIDIATVKYNYSDAKDNSHMRVHI